MLTPHQQPAPRIQRIKSHLNRCGKCEAMTSHDEDGRCLVCECAILKAKLKRRSR